MGKRLLEDRERYWVGVVRRQAVSGRSVRAFCQSEEVNEASFYAWRRKIELREVAQSSATPSFLPVTIATPQASSVIVIELPGGRIVRLPETTSTERLLAVLKALTVAEVTR